MAEIPLEANEADALEQRWYADETDSDEEEELELPLEVPVEDAYEQKKSVPRNEDDR